MTEKDFIQAVRTDAGLTEDEVKFGLGIFMTDAEGKTGYIAEFSHFIKFVLDKYYHKYYHDLYLITRNYISTLEASGNSNPMLLGFLYISAAEYFMTFDVYTEALRNVNKALELEKSLPPYYIAVILQYSIAIIEMSGNNEYMIPIVDKMEAIIERKEFAGYYRFHLALDLMEAFASLGNKEKSDYYYALCKTFSQEEIGEVEYNLVELTRISTLAQLLSEEKPDDEYIVKLRECTEAINKGDGIKASYYKYFMPIFSYVRGYIADEEIISYVRKCIEASYMLKDRIQLYQYLFGELGVDKKADDKLFKGYCSDLQSHFEMINSMQKYEVLGELIAREQMQKYKTSAETDELTGLGNRRAYDLHLQEYIKKGALPENFHLLTIDLNGLKNVNDDFGHDAGDELLKAAAGCMRSAFDTYGEVYRTGGDEFFALLSVKEDEMKAVFDALAKAAVTWSEANGRKLSFAIGYAHVGENSVVENLGESIETAISHMTSLADERMYQDKKEYYRINGIERRRS